MKSFVSCHVQRFKKSQVVGLGKHHKRELHKDENVIKEFSHLNRSRLGKYSFDELELKMVELKQKAGKKASNLAFRKDANVMLDNVITLSRERVEQLRKEHPDKWQDLILDCCVDLAGKMQKTWGLTPYSINLHCDEGRFEGGEFLCNYHVHLSLFNFDFKKLVQPMRTMTRSDFSVMQDMAGDAFKSLGFVRGHARELTGKRHLDKNEYVTEQLKEKAEKVKALENKALMLEGSNKQAERDCLTATEKLRHVLKNTDLLEERVQELNLEIRSLRESKAKEEASAKHIHSVLSDARKELELASYKRQAEEKRLMYTIVPKLRLARAELEQLEAKKAKIQEPCAPYSDREFYFKRMCDAFEEELKQYKERFGDLAQEDVQDLDLENLILNGTPIP